MASQVMLMAAMAFAALLGAIGQFAMKKGSGLGLKEALPWLAGFAALYGIGVIINYVAYRAGGRVSLLYPVIALSYVFAAVIAWKFLGEPFSAWTAGGIVLILAGVTLIGVGAA